MKRISRTRRLAMMTPLVLLRWGAGVIFGIIVFMEKGGNSAALFISTWAFANLLWRICATRLFNWAEKFRDDDNGAWSLEGGMIPARMHLVLLFDLVISFLMPWPFAAYHLDWI